MDVGPTVDIFWKMLTRPSNRIPKYWRILLSQIPNPFLSRIFEHEKIKKG